jgi:probable phosphoglycerate mutase
VVVVCHGVVCKVLLLALLPGHAGADWERIGRAKNLSVSELVPAADRWAARRLLFVPPPVETVNALFEEVGIRKTEA